MPWSRAINLQHWHQVCISLVTKAQAHRDRHKHKSCTNSTFWSLCSLLAFLSVFTVASTDLWKSDRFFTVTQKSSKWVFTESKLKTFSSEHGPLHLWCLSFGNWSPFSLDLHIQASIYLEVTCNLQWLSSWSGFQLSVIKTQVIPLACHKGHRQSKQPITKLLIYLLVKKCQMSSPDSYVGFAFLFDSMTKCTRVI